MIYFWGDEEVMGLMILSQVVLSLQLAFAVIPLVKFTEQQAEDGSLRQPPVGASSGLDRDGGDRQLERQAGL